MDILTTIRSKPKYVREKIAFGSALLFVVILFVFWIISFEASGPDEATRASTASPFNELRDAITTFSEDVTAAVGDGSKTDKLSTTTENSTILPDSKKVPVTE